MFACEDYDQAESEAIQLARAMFGRNPTNYGSEQEFSSNASQSQSDTTEVLKESCSPSRSLYEIPDDFDPDNEDYNLSDVETVTSDEALQAWGVGERHPDVEEMDIPPACEKKNIYEEVDDQDEDNEEGWEGDIGLQLLNNILVS